MSQKRSQVFLSTFLCYAETLPINENQSFRTDGAWEPMAPVPHANAQVTRYGLVGSEDGSKLVLVGFLTSFATAYVYDVAQDSWSPTGSMVVPVAGYVKQEQTLFNDLRAENSCKKKTSIDKWYYIERGSLSLF